MARRLHIHDFFLVNPRLNLLLRDAQPDVIPSARFKGHRLRGFIFRGIGTVNG